ncbi:patatin-like phospholipase family protein [Brachybacterium hainanense]|uniref:Patatin-like phospholipase family protein n=1 Tax=Brachybacterium hainanense TaxID=1541174 RepID=A0ABV6RCB6_9MICO
MTALSQPPPPVPAGAGARVDLVLEGGGVKGIAIAGALEVLEERGYRPCRIAGSSAGAIAGALVSAGVPAPQLVEILRATDFHRFEDGPAWTRVLPGRALEILLHQGIHRGDALADWLAEQLQAHGTDPGCGDPHRTFGALRWSDPDGPGAPAAPELEHRLVVTASDLSAGRLRHLPRDASAYGIRPDDLRILDAVRASVAIPLYFRPVRWPVPGGLDAWLVDGGLLSNYPIDVFDAPPGDLPRWPTFGIKLSGRPETDFGIVTRITGPLSYAKAVADTVTGFYDRMHIESSHAVARTIFIDTHDVRPTDFDLTAAQREMLYRRGRASATEFLDGSARQEPWDFDRYIARYRTATAAGP